MYPDPGHIHMAIATLANSQVRINSGGARGPDRWGEESAAILGLPVKQFKAQWTDPRTGKKRRGAGMERNRRMLSETDHLIVFYEPNLNSKSMSGTLNMRDITQAAGRTWEMHYSDGRVEGQMIRPRWRGWPSVYHAMCHHTLLCDEDKDRVVTIEDAWRSLQVYPRYQGISYFDCDLYHTIGVGGNPFVAPGVFEVKSEMDILKLPDRFAKVIPVNLSGVMASGLAKQAVDLMPEILPIYKNALANGLLSRHRSFTIQLRGSTLILVASDCEEAGLELIADQVSHINEDYNLNLPLVFPMTGAGLGRLRWEDVLDKLCDLRHETYILRRRI